MKDKLYSILHIEKKSFRIRIGENFDPFVMELKSNFS